MQKHFSSFAFSFLLSLGIIYTSKADASAAQTITLTPTYVKFTSKDTSTSVNLHNVGDIFVHSGAIHSSEANVSFTDFCTLTPTATSYELFAEYQKEKTTWAKTVVINDIIYALQYNFSIQALRPQVYTDSVNGKRRIRFVDYGTYSTPLWKGIHFSHSMNVALVHVSHLTSLVLIVNDFVYFGSLSGNSLTFSHEIGPFKLKQQEFRKVFVHNKRLYVHVDNEKIHVYDLSSIKTFKFLGNIGHGVLKLQYANYTDILPINNRYLLISDYNFGIIKVDDVDLYNIVVKGRFTGIPNVTRIVEHDNDVAVVSDYEESVSVTVVTRMFVGHAQLSRPVTFEPTPVKQVDFDHSRLYLTTDYGVRAFYYQKPSDTTLSLDHQYPKSQLRIPKTYETLFLSIDDWQKGQVGWLMVTREKMYLLKVKDAVPELRCNMTAALQGTTPNFFKSYRVNLELHSNDCLTNSSENKECTLMQEVVFQYYDTGVLGAVEEHSMLVGSGSLGVMLAVVVATQLCRSRKSVMRDAEQGNLHEGKKKKKKKQPKTKKSKKLAEKLPEDESTITNEGDETERPINLSMSSATETINV